MTIKDYGDQKETNWRQLFIICSVLVSAYLINGEHAQAVCNICTTVPAAIFTYKQLSDRATRVFAYVSSLGVTLTILYVFCFLQKRPTFCRSKFCASEEEGRGGVLIIENNRSIRLMEVKLGFRMEKH